MTRTEAAIVIPTRAPTRRRASHEYCISKLPNPTRLDFTRAPAQTPKISDLHRRFSQNKVTATPGRKPRKGTAMNAGPILVTLARGETLALGVNDRGFALANRNLALASAASYAERK